eukprot:tig00022099_g23810.t1
MYGDPADLMGDGFRAPKPSSLSDKLPQSLPRGPPTRDARRGVGRHLPTARTSTNRRPLASPGPRASTDASLSAALPPLAAAPGARPRTSQHSARAPSPLESPPVSAARPGVYPTPEALQRAASTPLLGAAYFARPPSRALGPRQGHAESAASLPPGALPRGAGPTTTRARGASRGARPSPRGPTSSPRASPTPNGSAPRWASRCRPRPLRPRAPARCLTAAQPSFPPPDIPHFATPPPHGGRAGSVPALPRSASSAALAGPGPGPQEAPAPAPAGRAGLQRSASMIAGEAALAASAQTSRPRPRPDEGPAPARAPRGARDAPRPGFFSFFGAGAAKAADSAINRRRRSSVSPDTLAAAASRTLAPLAAASAPASPAKGPAGKGAVAGSLPPRGGSSVRRGQLSAREPLVHKQALAPQNRRLLSPSAYEKYLAKLERDGAFEELRPGAAPAPGQAGKSARRAPASVRFQRVESVSSALPGLLDSEDGSEADAGEGAPGEAEAEPRLDGAALEAAGRGAAAGPAWERFEGALRRRGSGEVSRVRLAQIQARLASAASASSNFAVDAAAADPDAGEGEEVAERVGWSEGVYDGAGGATARATPDDPVEELGPEAEAAYAEAHLALANSGRLSYRGPPAAPPPQRGFDIPALPPWAGPAAPAGLSPIPSAAPDASAAASSARPAASLPASVSARAAGPATGRSAAAAADAPAAASPPTRSPRPPARCAPGEAGAGGEEAGAVEKEEEAGRSLAVPTLPLTELDKVSVVATSGALSSDDSAGPESESGTDGEALEAAAAGRISSSVVQALTGLHVGHKTGGQARSMADAVAAAVKMKKEQQRAQERKERREARRKRREAKEEGGRGSDAWMLSERAGHDMDARTLQRFFREGGLTERRRLGSVAPMSRRSIRSLNASFRSAASSKSGAAGEGAATPALSLASARSRPEIEEWMAQAEADDQRESADVAARLGLATHRARGAYAQGARAFTFAATLLMGTKQWLFRARLRRYIRNCRNRVRRPCWLAWVAYTREANERRTALRFPFHVWKRYTRRRLKLHRKAQFLADVLDTFRQLHAFRLWKRWAARRLSRRRVCAVLLQRRAQAARARVLHAWRDYVAPKLALRRLLRSREGRRLRARAALARPFAALRYHAAARGACARRAALFHCGDDPDFVPPYPEAAPLRPPAERPEGPPRFEPTPGRERRRERPAGLAPSSARRRLHPAAQGRASAAALHRRAPRPPLRPAPAAGRAAAEGLLPAVAPPRAGDARPPRRPRRPPRLKRACAERGRRALPLRALRAWARYTRNAAAYKEEERAEEEAERRRAEKEARRAAREADGRSASSSDSDRGVSDSWTLRRRERVEKRRALVRAQREAEAWTKEQRERAKALQGIVTEAEAAAARAAAEAREAVRRGEADMRAEAAAAAAARESLAQRDEAATEAMLGVVKERIEGIERARGALLRLREVELRQDRLKRMEELARAMGTMIKRVVEADARREALAWLRALHEAAMRHKALAIRARGVLRGHLRACARYIAGQRAMGAYRGLRARHVALRRWLLCMEGAREEQSAEAARAIRRRLELHAKAGAKLREARPYTRPGALFYRWLQFAQARRARRRVLELFARAPAPPAPPRPRPSRPAPAPAPAATPAPSAPPSRRGSLAGSEAGGRAGPSPKKPLPIPTRRRPSAEAPVPPPSRSRRRRRRRSRLGARRVPLRRAFAELSEWRSLFLVPAARCETAWRRRYNRHVARRARGRAQRAPRVRLLLERHAASVLFRMQVEEEALMARCVREGVPSLYVEQACEARRAALLLLLHRSHALVRRCLRRSAQAWEEPARAGAGLLLQPRLAMRVAEWMFDALSKGLPRALLPVASRPVRFEPAPSRPPNLLADLMAPPPPAPRPPSAPAAPPRPPPTR